MINFAIERLKQLPQRPNDTWQGGFIRMPGWLEEEGGKPFRAVTVMWGSLNTGKVSVSEDIRPKDKADVAMAVDALADFATGGHGGYRPGRIEVNDPALSEHLSLMLAGANICVEYRDCLRMIEQSEEYMARFMSKDGPVPQGYLQVKGVTTERVRAFAEAAGLFYEAAPWRHLGNEDLIEIESPRKDDACRFAVVMGAGGREFGLGFYKSQERYWDSYDSGDPSVFLTGGGVWSLTFDDITAIPFADADLWEDGNLPVAGENAYPVAMYFEPPMRTRRPGPDLMTFFEGLMRALSAATEDEMDSGRWTKQVATFSGPMEFTLSLPFLLKPPAREKLFKYGFFDRRSMETTHLQIERLLEGREFADVDEMNAAINEMMPLAQSRCEPRNAAEEAQDLCFQAFDSIGRRRIVLARKALQICPDCADAYVILAENTPSLEKAGEYYAAGVQAGRRALGEQCFQQDAGYFWGITKTRPFMRALFGLAQTREEIGQIAQAVDDYRELLRLNPNDNQGVRYVLLPLLLAEGRQDEAGKLLADFADDRTAMWLYCRALLSFIKEGDTPESRRQLQKAIKANRHAPKYLLGDAEIDYVPETYKIGSEEEAVICAMECGRAWRAMPAALDWLRTQAAKPQSKRKKTASRRKNKKS